MKIYLAASYSRRQELQSYAAQLRADGHTVTARWITGVHDDPHTNEATCAQDDVADIYAADCTLSFTDSPTSGRKRGGRHVEFGIALARDQLLVLVGPRENVFHHLPNVKQYDTFEAARAALK